MVQVRPDQCAIESTIERGMNMLTDSHHLRRETSLMIVLKYKINGALGLFLVFLLNLVFSVVYLS